MEIAGPRLDQNMSVKVRIEYIFRLNLSNKVGNILSKVWMVIYTLHSI